VHEISGPDWTCPRGDLLETGWSFVTEASGHLLQMSGILIKTQISKSHTNLHTQDLLCARSALKDSLSPVSLEDECLMLSEGSARSRESCFPALAYMDWQIEIDR
jgi:hypothetical protein